MEDNDSMQDLNETNMSIQAGFGPTTIHEPIHESLTLAALINSHSGVAEGTTLGKASNDEWEYIRGAVWNDDPECLLYSNRADNNHDLTTVGSVLWAKQYLKGEADWKTGDGLRFRNPTGRSHYGDLQFLHCMACETGEKPEESKRKVMLWLEVMYKLAAGEDGITSDLTIRKTRLTELWPAGSLPPATETLRYMLSGKESKFQGMDPRRRAIGSIFHIIQDSYAIGHTRRVPLNQQDMLSEHPLKYKPGIADRWGPIENFHCYGGQNTDAHSHFDHSNESIPDPHRLSDLAQWDGLLGCRDAVDKCVEFMSLKQAGKKWDDGVRKFFDDGILKLSETATPANSQVW